MSGHRIPSLINGSAGRPGLALAGKKSTCKGCGREILKGEKCVDIPNPRAAFASSKRFCCNCFKEIIAKTKQELATFEVV